MTFKFETELEKLIYEALRIRLAEQRCAEIYPSDKVQSPIHLSIGQEHISVGACAALRKTDLVFVFAGLIAALLLLLWAFLG